MGRFTAALIVPFGENRSLLRLTEVDERMEDLSVLKVFATTSAKLRWLLRCSRLGNALGGQSVAQDPEGSFRRQERFFALADRFFEVIVDGSRSFQGRFYVLEVFVAVGIAHIASTGGSGEGMRG